MYIITRIEGGELTSQKAERQWFLATEMLKKERRKLLAKFKGLPKEVVEASITCDKDKRFSIIIGGESCHIYLTEVLMVV